MADGFSKYPTGPTAPYDTYVALTPNDTVDLANVTRALYVGGAGNISVDDLSGNTAVVFTGVPAGTVLSIRVKRLRLTGTTATNIVGLT